MGRAGVSGGGSPPVLISRACAPPRFATAGSRSPSTPIPSPRTGSCSSASAPPVSTAPTCCRSPASTPRRRARRPTSRASSSPARSSRAAAGSGRFEPGDRVMAIVAGGGQAELAVVHERTAMPVPDELDWTAAGGVPEVFTTAHDALFTQAGLTVGERLLVHGAAGGVGMAAVQLGEMAGARVTATVRNEHAREQIGAFGVACDPSGGVLAARRVRRDPRTRRRPEHGREHRRAGDRRPDLRDRRRRRRDRSTSTCAS